MFQNFKADFNRQYASVAEEQRRFGCFVRTLANIERLNSVDTAVHVVNKFADLCAEDFKMFHNLKFPNATATPHRIFTKAELQATPAEIDWRTLGAVNAVKDQQQCGSCWTFSAVMAMEGAWKLAGNPLVSLSEEELVQCAKSAGNGCQGGEMTNAINWVVSHGGINSEEAYPYTSGSGFTGWCNAEKSSKSVAKFTGVIKAPQDEEQIAAYLVKYGPLFIAVDATDGWQTYGGGIKSNCNGKHLDHGVGIVGMTADYWIVRNSWGPSWGENGYIRLKKGINCDLLNSDVGTAKV